jgi:hypothetical protein
MIRSAFAADSPAQSGVAAAQVSALSDLSELPELPAAKAIVASFLEATPRVRAGMPARYTEMEMAVSLSDWQLLFSAVTARLQAFARGELAQSAGTPGGEKLQVEQLTLDCAIALELLHKILLTGLKGPATAVCKFDSENN